MGKRPYRCRAGIYPPAFFSPGPADPIPPYDGGGPRRGNNNTTQHNDTMASPRGPGATIAPRELQLILSGIPLSLIYPIYTPYIPHIYPIYTPYMSIFRLCSKIFLQKKCFDLIFASSSIKNPHELEISVLFHLTRRP